jgi:hypothetical protein
MQARVDRPQSGERGLLAAEQAGLSWAKITRWTVISGAAALVATAVLPVVEPDSDAEAPLFELFGDNEIPNVIIDDLIELGGDVVSFLLRMVPGI